MSNPLEDIYLRSAKDFPQLEAVANLQVPQPFRDLLVHEKDMTPTLEAFHGQRIHLHVLDRHRQENQLLRLVVLKLEGDEKPVEFGAIRIDLALLKAEAVRLILEEQRPLGTILREQRIFHTSGPKQFFSVLPDDLVNRELELTGTHRLYGRCNVIQDSRGRALAEMTEILPPITGSSTR